MQTAAIQLRNATTYVPRTQTEATGLPPAFANYPFVCVHYPHGWAYSEEWGFVPELSEIVSKPGVNGVEIHGQGPNAVINNTKAIAGSLKKGGRIIDPKDSRLGDFREYVVFYPTTNGGKHFCFAGSEFEILPGGHVKQTDTSANYMAFKLHVRDAGLVEPMARSVYLKLRDMEHTALNRLVRRSADSPFYQEKVKAKEARMLAMDKAWEAYCAKVAAPAVDEVPAGKMKLKAKPAAVNTKPAEGADGQ